MKIERRFYKTEIRILDGSSDQPKISGYAAVFNQRSEDLGGFVEIIEPGAFSEAIENDDVRALFNHDSNLILGRSSAGTLQLAEDDLGLRYEIIPPGTQYASDLIISLERGDIDQSSFGFLVTDEIWETKDEQPVRIVKKVQLFDVSPVTFPAYPQTSAEAREMALTLTHASSGATTGQANNNPAGRLDVNRKRLQLLTIK